MLVEYNHLNGDLLINFGFIPESVGLTDAQKTRIFEEVKAHFNDIERVDSKQLYEITKFAIDKIKKAKDG